MAFSQVPPPHEVYYQTEDYGEGNLYHPPPAAVEEEEEDLPVPELVLVDALPDKAWCARYSMDKTEDTDNLTEIDLLRWHREREAAAGVGNFTSYSPWLSQGMQGVDKNSRRGILLTLKLGNKLLKKNHESFGAISILS